MNGSTHVKIVRAAISFLFSGDDKEKAIISSYFVNKRSTMEQLDLSAKKVDYYQDLANNACGKGNIVIANGHPVTAINHYLFAFSEGGLWQTGSTTCSGYTYSRTPYLVLNNLVLRSSGDDDMRTAGKLGANVDYSNSLCLERIRPWFKGTNWSQNWSCDIDETEYVPANIMAGMYYQSLLKKTQIPVSRPGTSISAGCAYISTVSPVGEDITLSGLGLLAPVLHLIADMCVPHHVAGTNGCGHQTWENLVESDCFGKVFGLYDFNEAQDIFEKLRPSVYEISPTDVNGDQLVGVLSVEELLLAIAVQTVSSICDTTGMSREEILKAGITFWEKYIAAQTKKVSVNQRKYLFNLAVAASAFFLIRAYSDLVKCRLMKATSNILPPPEFKSVPEKQLETQRILPFASGTPWPIPGFQELIAQMNGVFDVHDIHQIDASAARGVLELEERFLFKRFVAGYRSAGKAYCPIGVDLGGVFPDIHHASGLATFRLPSREEAKDQKKWKEYLSASEIYGYKARLYQFVFVIAALRAFQQVRGADKKISVAIETLRNCVQEALRQKTASALQLPMGNI